MGQPLAILRDTKGESLMEGIASILVFIVLSASVTMMITLSLGITRRSTEGAGELQREANAALAVMDGGDTPIATESGAVELVTEGFTVKIPVSVYSTAHFTSFEPEGGGEP